MIRAVFERGKDGLRQVEISGHAGFAEAGEDIVCASVTSALQLTANGITEVLRLPARVETGENRVLVSLDQWDSRAGDFLQALYLHMRVLSEEYDKYIRVTVLEV